jgi:hypothetical protein
LKNPSKIFYYYLFIFIEAKVELFQSISLYLNLYTTYLIRFFIPPIIVKNSKNILTSCPTKVRIMVKCDKCGHINNGYATFCENCGANLKKTSSSGFKREFVKNEGRMNKSTKN